MLFCIKSSFSEDYEMVFQESIVDVVNHGIFSDLMIFFGNHIPHILIKEVVRCGGDRGGIVTHYFIFEDKFYIDVRKRFDNVKIYKEDVLSSVVNAHDQFKNSSWFDSDCDRFDLNVYAVGDSCWHSFYALKLGGILTLKSENCLGFMCEMPAADLMKKWPDFQRWVGDYIAYLEESPISPHELLDHEVCESSEVAANNSPSLRDRQGTHNAPVG